MNKVQIEILENEIKVYEGNKILKLDEEKWPELRQTYGEGLYDAFIDRTEEPYKIKFMTKISS